MSNNNLKRKKDGTAIQNFIYYLFSYLFIGIFVIKSFTKV